MRHVIVWIGVLRPQRTTEVIFLAELYSPMPQAQRSSLADVQETDRRCSIVLILSTTIGLKKLDYSTWNAEPYQA